MNKKLLFILLFIFVGCTSNQSSTPSLNVTSSEHITSSNISITTSSTIIKDEYKTIKEIKKKV